MQTEREEFPKDVTSSKIHEKFSRQGNNGLSSCWSDFRRQWVFTKGTKVSCVIVITLRGRLCPRIITVTLHNEMETAKCEDYSGSPYGCLIAKN